jgi:APA family basic amino acid/polyamine antiporter
MTLQLFRRKKIDNTDYSNGLRRTLNAWDLTFLGIGAIIGAGIFVLTGKAAATTAGPGIVFSYIFASLACAFSALCYAELAASVGGCGGAYDYAYASLGELVAWFIGWQVLLEYGMGAVCVAIGWSAYAGHILSVFNIHVPPALLSGPFEGGIVNLPAVLVIFAISAIIASGGRQSAKTNLIMVSLKLIAILAVIFVSVKHVQPSNWHPFLPFGYKGVMTGAGLVFFAYIGFDAVATAAEETINPQRNLPLGIIGSLVVCTILYITLSLILTGVVPYPQLDNAAPVSFILTHLGYVKLSIFVGFAALCALTTVILVLIFALNRVILAMSRDGLLSIKFSSLHKTRRTPTYTITVCAILMAICAGLLPMNQVAELINMGTLAAFIVVCLGVLILRYKEPNLPRSFKAPFIPYTPILGIICCLSLMFSLNSFTWLAVSVWVVLGMAIYIVYGYKHSNLTKAVTQ